MSGVSTLSTVKHTLRVNGGVVQTLRGGVQGPPGLNGGAADTAAVTHAAASKVIPIDADELPLVDSAATNALKKLTWASLKTAIASFFGTLASDTQLLFNDAGVISGSAGLTFDKTNKALTVGGATVTTSQPVVNLAQTWNAVAVVFTGWKFNVTDTASAAASLLIDLQAGGASRFSVQKDGVVNLRSNGQYLKFSALAGFGHNSGGENPYAIANSTVPMTWMTNGNLMAANSFLGWSSSNLPHTNGAFDVAIYRGAANTLEQRNGANAQTFRLYNTYTDASNYERGFARWSGNEFQVGTESAGTGTARFLTLSSQSSAQVIAPSAFYINSAVGVTKWLFDNSTGQLRPGTDNTGDLGNASARVRTVYAGTSVEAPRIKTTALTVATLTAAATAGAGTRSFVTDATATTFASIVAGGGANGVPVYSDGTNWRIG